MTFGYDLRADQCALGLATGPVAVVAALAAIALAPVRATSMDSERVNLECSFTAPAPLHALRHLGQRRQLAGAVLPGPGGEALSAVVLKSVAGG